MTVNKLRRLLNQNGYDLRKGRQAFGVYGYMIIDRQMNACVAGSGFTLTLDDVCQWTERELKRGE